MTSLGLFGPLFGLFGASLGSRLDPAGRAIQLRSG